MKNLLILLMIFQSHSSFSQDKFYQSLKQLETELDYYSEIENDDKKYKNLSFYAEIFEKNKAECAEYNPEIKNLNFNEFISAKSTNIKSKKPLGGNTYLRVTIEEWTFNNEKNAKQFTNKLKYGNLECLNKGGIEFWTIQNKVYFIISPATLFSYEFEKIKKVLNMKLY